jgi:hypothetical protein
MVVVLIAVAVSKMTMTMLLTLAESMHLWLPRHSTRFPVVDVALRPWDELEAVVVLASGQEATAGMPCLKDVVRNTALRQQAGRLQRTPVVSRHCWAVAMQCVRLRAQARLIQ